MFSSSRPLYTRFAAVLLLLFVPSVAAAFSAAPDEADTTTAPFSVQFGDEVISRPIMAVFVMPESTTRLEIASSPPKSKFEVNGSEGHLQTLTNREWHFLAPQSPGLYPLTISDSTSGAAIRLQVFVLHPWNHVGGTLSGFRVGRYEPKGQNQPESFERPKGFVKVTAENRNAFVSPNFRLDQFLCKQTDEVPQFALVRTRLLQKLEQILKAINEEGHDVSTLHVMSGFRTPYYNRAIGNTTEYSRHLYGGAADIFVDADKDVWMDDLTGDGRVTKADARYLADIVERLYTEEDKRFIGGLGVYGPASHRGPFIHVDVRGYRARW